jgi:hypothetical protein
MNGNEVEGPEALREYAENHNTNSIEEKERIDGSHGKNQESKFSRIGKYERKWITSNAEQQLVLEEKYRPRKKIKYDK